jgi:DNA repair exonuclease SbcCD ATPase subunit
MQISELEIRGFKSYGNNPQILKLNTEKGELILLMGGNAQGKSSLLESFEYCIYGKVRSGKSKKWSKLSLLPNRINGTLLNRIKFNSLGTDIEVKRGISPNILELSENGIINERAGKSNIDDKIEQYVGMDVETFKSFISMNVDSFKNFISLSNEEKQLLLDKLFNLEIINILNSILKDINKNNKIRLTSLDAEIKTLNESVVSIQNSIKKSIEKEKENIQQEIDEIKIEMDLKKDEYLKLKNNVTKIKEKETILNDELDSEKKQYIIVQNDIKNVQKELDLYDQGKCPTCGTDFNSEHFITLKGILNDKKRGFNNIKLAIENNVKIIKEKQIKLNNLSEKTTKSFNDLNYLLKNYKDQIDKLNKKKSYENEINSIIIKEFNNTIDELNNKKIISHNNITECKEKELYYKELNRIFGEEGVKKSIISSIIKPINHFISENIKNMELPYEVKLDETFTAEITQLGTIIDHDSLSTGETKLTNIAILIAYLKLIRTKRYINILFLDEVFSSVDTDNIQKILNLLKSFANEYKINIFVVHHAVLNQEMFDRILRIEKNVFSQIIEINMNNDEE